MSADHDSQRDLPRRLLAQLVFDWLEARSGEPVEAEDGANGLYSATLAADRLTVAIEPAGTPEPPAAWTARLDAFASRLTPGNGGVLVWLPPGAEPPAQEPAATATVVALQQAIDG